MLLVLFLLPLVVGFSWLIATVPNEWIDRRLGFVAPTSVRVGPEEEAKLLNPLVRRIIYDRLPNDNDKGWWRRWLLSYRVLIVEDTDLGADADERVVAPRARFCALPCSAGRTFTAPILRGLISVARKCGRRWPKASSKTPSFRALF